MGSRGRKGPHSFPRTIEKMPRQSVLPQRRGVRAEPTAAAVHSLAIRVTQIAPVLYLRGRIGSALSETFRWILI